MDDFFEFLLQRNEGQQMERDTETKEQFIIFWVSGMLYTDAYDSEISDGVR